MSGSTDAHRLGPTRRSRAVARLLHDHLVGEIDDPPRRRPDAWRALPALLGRHAGLSSAPTAASRACGRRWPAATSSCARSTTPKCCASGRVARRSVGRDRLELPRRHDDALARRRSDVGTGRLAEDGDRIAELMGAVEERSTGGIGAKSAALMRMIRGFVKSVSAKRARPARSGAEQHRVGRRSADARDADRPAGRRRGRPRRHRRRPGDAGRRQPHVRSRHRRLRVAKRDRARHADRSPCAGVPDARRRGTQERERVLSLARTEVSRRRRSAPRRDSTPSGRTSRRSC